MGEDGLLWSASTLLSTLANHNNWCANNTDYYAYSVRNALINYPDRLANDYNICDK